MSNEKKKTNPNLTQGEVMDKGSELVTQREIQNEKLREIIKNRKGKKSMDNVNENAEPATNVTQDNEVVQAVVVNPKYDGYLKELKQYVDDSKALLDEIYTRTVRLTFNYIQMGNIFTVAKENLSKDDFKKLSEFYDLDERSVYRYMSLVKDDRVSELSIEQLSKMLNPSMSKLNKMSKLKDDDDFTKVLSGEDTPLLSLKIDKEKSNPFSEYLNDEDYKKLNKMTKVEIIEYFIDELTTKNEMYKELSVDHDYLIDIVESNNLYNFEEKNEVA